MNGYLRVATISENLSVGNAKNNSANIIRILSDLNSNGVKIAVTQRLALTSCGLNDLYLDENIIKDVEDAIFSIVENTKTLDMVSIIGSILKYNNKIYEVAVVINKGNILGIVPRDNYSYNEPVFSTYHGDATIELYDKYNDKNYIVPYKSDMVFVNENNPNVKFAIKFEDEIDILGANIIFNLHSIKETVDVDKYYNIYKYKSKEHRKTYVVASPNYTESTTKDVYTNRSMIYEYGELIAKSSKISDEYVIGDIDIDKTICVNKNVDEIFDEDKIMFNVSNMLFDDAMPIYRKLDTTPYINKNINPYNYSMHIINMQAIGLLKRFKSIHADTFVLGLSGGLDSTLALLVIKKACDIGSIPFENIKCLVLPSFASSNESLDIAYNLCKSLMINPITIDIKNAVANHLSDINHDINNKNNTYENAQARERMQVLMDVANDNNGLVVGTSDLSEIALGFSTYNGDHMSMYNVNGGIPKTLIRYILSSIANYNINNNGNIALGNILIQILNRPISPELVNDDPSFISQKTEDILGPYKLIDFYMYYYLSYHFSKEKLFDMAKRCFIYNESEDEKYDINVLSNTLDNFMNRFYKSQYKRNCSPDTISIGLPDLNSKCSFVAPSDIEI